MVTQAPKKSAVAIALTFALSCVALIIFVWIQFGGTIPFSPQGYRIKAQFNETGLLVPNADVRIAGVNIGKVKKVQAQGQNSMVTMDILSQYAPLPKDTQAILRAKTLLGEAYVTLSSGNGQGPKLPDEGTIPVTQIQKTTQLDQLLNTFTPKVQREFQNTLLGIGTSLNGRGEAINNSLGNLDPATTELTSLLHVVNGQQTNIQNLINNSANVLGTLGQRGSDIQNLISSGDSVFAATAAENQSLTNTVNALPPFLRQLQTSLASVDNTLRIAHPSLSALQPVLPLLTPALRGLNSATGPLVSFLQAAPYTLRLANQNLPAVDRFMGTLKPLLDQLLPVSEQLVPMINVAKDYTPQIIDGMANLAAVTEAQDSAPGATASALGIPAGTAKYARIYPTLGPDSTFGAPKRSAGVLTNGYPTPGSTASPYNLTASACPGGIAVKGTGNIACQIAQSFAWTGLPQSYYPHVRAKRP